MSVQQAAKAAGFYTIRQAAKKFNVKAQSLYQRVRVGTVPAPTRTLPRSSKLYYDEADLTKLKKALDANPIRSIDRRPVEDCVKDAAVVLYETGRFSKRQIAALLDVAVRSVWNWVHGINR